MLRKFLCLLVLASVVTLGSGCRTATPVKPKGNVAIVIDRTKRATAGTARLENLVTLTLPPVAAGQVWQIADHDARFLKQVQDIKPSDAAGAGPTVAFVAVNSTARTRVRFLLLPSLDSRDPIDLRELVLEIR